VLMGKNTMIRKGIRGKLHEKPELESLLHHVHGNIGFVFTKGDLSQVRDVVLKNRVAAPAKAGSIAPCHVWVPAGNTGMGPEKTSFFQALGISTKITKGTVEIISDVHLIKTGDKVGPSQATLLNMMKISPFTFGLSMKAVYDRGQCFDPTLLDITDEQISKEFQEEIRKIAAISLALKFPTMASAPHDLAHGYKNLLAVALSTDYSFPEADKVKHALENPHAFAAVSAVTAHAAPAAASKPEAAPVQEEEEDGDMGFGLFD